jgi:hypothetical protein
LNHLNSSDGIANMSEHRGELDRRAFFQNSLVLGVGIVVGSASRERLATDRVAGAATPNATATRQAELEELHALQTQVAEPLVCTPVAAAVPPTATQVPLASTGVLLPYLDIWVISILGIAPALAPNDLRPNGKFMQLNLTAAHSASTPQLLALTKFVLMDSGGAFAVPEISVNQKFFGTGWGLHIQPGVTENLSVVFDVAADAGDSFILESNADPTFRVGMTIEQRG